MAKKRKKRVFKVKNIIIILVIFCLLVGFFWYAITSPVKNIYISGNKLVSDDEVLTLSGLGSYPSFLLSSRKEIVNSILVNDYIENVNIKKRFGNVIEIEVDEASVIAINLDGMLILSNGKVISNSYGYTDVARLVSDIDNVLLKEFANKFDKVDMNILREISEVFYSPVDVDSERFILYMNDGNVVHVTLTKIEKLNRYNDIKDELVGKRGIIYLDSGDYVELDNETDM